MGIIDRSHPLGKIAADEKEERILLLLIDELKTSDILLMVPNCLKM